MVKSRILSCFPIGNKKKETKSAKKIPCNKKKEKKEKKKRKNEKNPRFYSFLRLHICEQYLDFNNNLFYLLHLGRENVQQQNQTYMKSKRK